jgi:hypothetical protein
MGHPTIYKFPRKSLPPRKPSEEILHRWKKHQETLGKSPNLPIKKSK